MSAPANDQNVESCVPIPLLPHPDVTKWNRCRRHRRETTNVKKKKEDPCECCRMGRSGYTCVRHTLCCVNLLFWMIGCGLLGIGIWMHLAYGGYASLMPTYRSLSADSLCIAAGVITFLIGFFGCCGSWFQSKCLLRMYFGLVIIVFILEFTAGIVGFAFRRQVGETIRDELKIAIQEKYGTSDDGGLAEVWDQLQIDFECCGVTSYHDWYNAATWPSKEWVPRSCCIQRFHNITSCGEKGEVYRWQQSGCYQRLHTWLMERLYIVGIVSVVFAFIQLFGLISAMLIICILIDREKYR